MSPKKHEVKYIGLGIHVKNERRGRASCLTRTFSPSHEVFNDFLVEAYLEKALQTSSIQTGNSNDGMAGLWESWSERTGVSL